MTKGKEKEYVKMLNGCLISIQLDIMSAVNIGITDLEHIEERRISGYTGAAKCQQIHK